MRAIRRYSLKGGNIYGNVDGVPRDVVRRVFLKQPFAEVAEAIGRSQGAARVLWIRAIRKLRDELPDGDSGAFDVAGE